MLMRIVVIFLVCIAFVAVAEETQPPGEVNGLPLVFEDGFEDGMARWEPTDAKAWEVREDEGKQVLALHKSSEYSPPVRSPHSIAWVKNLNVSDFVLEVRARQTGREYGHRDLCFFFGRQDAGKFYYVHIATVADPHANSIFLVNDEPRVSIAEERNDGTDWAKGYHTIRVVRDAKAGTILVYFDDLEKPIMKSTDTHFTTGPVGVGSFDDTGNFDSVRIWAREVKE
jgi:hypothetical protein